MNCRKVNHFLSAYIDGELPGGDHRIIHEHLAQCQECYAEYEGLLDMKRMLGRLRMHEPPAALPTRILQHVEVERAREASRWSPGWFRQIRWWMRQPVPMPYGMTAIALTFVGVLYLTNLHTPVTGNGTGNGFQWSPVSGAPQETIVATPPPAPDPSIVAPGALRPVSSGLEWYDPTRSAPYFIPVTPIMIEDSKGRLYPMLPPGYRAPLTTQQARRPNR